MNSITNREKNVDGIGVLKASECVDLRGRLESMITYMKPNGAILVNLSEGRITFNPELIGDEPCIRDMRNTIAGMIATDFPALKAFGTPETTNPISYRPLRT
jgi:hypothetical protein